MESPQQIVNPVLWVGSEGPTEAFDNFHFVITREEQSPEQIIFNQERFTAVVFRGDYSTIRSKASVFVGRNPEVFVVGLVPENQLSLHLADLASSPFQRVFPDSIPLSLLAQEGFRPAERRLKARQLRRHYLHKLKDLEELNSSLEGRVNERTFHIQESHFEEQEKGKKERNLVRFIQDIQNQLSFDDVLSVLNNDLRKMVKGGEAFLVFSPEQGMVRAYFQSHDGLRESRGNYFSFPKNTVHHDQDLSRQMATLLGRPFGKAVFIPINLSLSRKFNRSNAQACIAIEHSFSETGDSQLIEYLQERVSPLSMALDRLLLEREISTLSYRWERAFEGFRNPIAIVNSQYKVLRSNLDLSSTQEESPCYVRIFGREKECENCPMSVAREQGTGVEKEIQNGDRFYQAVSFPIFEQGQRGNNYVNYYSDVTQFRELYLQLLQSEKIGAIGELAGHIAHELNNPLAGVRSLTQILIQEYNDRDGLVQDLKEIQKAAERSQKIIRNLLEFSTGAAGQLELVSVDELITKTLPMLKTILRGFRQAVLTRTNRFKVQVEPQLLQQVIFNLINNACQAMSEGGTLSIQSFRDDSWVVIEIGDTGPGIEPAVQKRIFEPFFTTKSEGKGTGLGLSLSKSIVESFGGRIDFRSELGKGTVFSVRLRIVSEEG